MSFQNTEVEVKTEVKEDLNNTQPTDFEKWVMQCCKAPEYELRRYMKKVLVRAGFEIFEDE